MSNKPFVFKKMPSLEQANNSPLSAVGFSTCYDEENDQLILFVTVWRPNYLFSECFGAVGYASEFDSNAYSRLIRFLNYLKEDTMAKLSNIDVLRMRLQVLDALRRERNIVITSPDFDKLSTWINDTDKEILEQIVVHLERLLHIAPVNR